MLTRQTCGQRSSRVAESKRRALGNYLRERICYVFPTSKCRGDWDLGLCTFWVLAKREPLRNAKVRFFLWAKHIFFRKSSLRLSGLEGQPTRQKKGLKLHMCKKCHRMAKECKGGVDCRATCKTTNRQSCQHLHQNAVPQQLLEGCSSERERERCA